MHHFIIPPPLDPQTRLTLRRALALVFWILAELKMGPVTCNTKKNDECSPYPLLSLVPLSPGYFPFAIL